MKKVYKYIEFKSDGLAHGLPQYVCLNLKTGDELGIVSWHRPWKEYVFSAQSFFCVFSVACLIDIGHFVKQANALQKESEA